VLCSTVSAGRPAVNEEARLFRSRHPDRPVIPVIIDGTWPDNFPTALRYQIAADGSVTDRPVTILGPDLRESADGKNLGPRQDSRRPHRSRPRRRVPARRAGAAQAKGGCARRSQR